MFFVPDWACKFSETEAGEDCGAEGNTEEDCHAFRYCRIRDANFVVGVADDLDEKDGKGSIENYLEDGVNGDEDGAVFIVPPGKTGPDEDLCVVSMCYICENSVKYLTIAMHLASPTRIRPTRSSGLSGKKAHARAN
jgi:hypothetical protein